MNTTFQTVLDTAQQTLVGSSNFTLTSQDIGGQLTLRHAYDAAGGQNISPQLSWTNRPLGTKSFALTMHDVDAPTGSGWWHWLVFDIPNSVEGMLSNAGDPEQNLLPGGVIQLKNDYGEVGYGGPCPPEGHGFHQYIFTVYALGVDKLGLDDTASAAAVGFHLRANTIEKASIVAYYKR